MLLNAGANKEAKTDDLTPLSIAIYFGHFETVKLLLEYKAEYLADTSHYALRLAEFLFSHPEERRGIKKANEYKQIKDYLMDHYFKNIDNLITTFNNNFCFK